MLNEVNLYCTLNLPRNASNDQIRKNYFLLARIFHPDKQQYIQPQEANSETFIRIEQAYKILIKRITRLIYDRYGHRGLNAYFQFEERFSKYEEVLNTEYSESIVKVKFLIYE